MFYNKNKPSMNEIINWFAVNYPEHWKSMAECNHAVTEAEPNPYHLENSIITHTMMVCQRAEIASETNYSKINLICALLHDIGKPMSMEEMEFKAKKPVYTESNQIRNDGKNDGKSSGMQTVVPPSGLKRAFRGHEGISFYLSIKILNKLQEIEVITQEEKQNILTIISIHGTLFDSISEDGEMKKPYKVFNKFINTNRIKVLSEATDLSDYTKSKKKTKEIFSKEIDLFNAFITQVKCDSTGRFFMSKDGRKSNGRRLGTEIFTEDQFIDYIIGTARKHSNENSLVLSKAYIKVLVGVPGSGKSTFLENNTGDAVVISRDDTLMEYARDKGIIGLEVKCTECSGYMNDQYPPGMKAGASFSYFGISCPKCNTGDILVPHSNSEYENLKIIKEFNLGVMTIKSYSDVWKYLSENNLQSEVDNMLQAKFKDAVKLKKNIIIDMTNISNKAQRKWTVNVTKEYSKEAIIFATGYEEVQRRLEKREQETGKVIPALAVMNMVKGFTVPNYSNFDEITWVF